MSRNDVEYKIGRSYDVTAINEISVSMRGFSFTCIYGQHVNGYYLAIPNWEWSCELAVLTDVLWNSESIEKMFGKVYDEDEKEWIPRFGEYTEPMSVALARAIKEDYLMQEEQ
ncbi:MAG: ribosome biogenesis regulatory protein homolog [Streptococcaceae bacterium]|jgi:hypothetical protein|nr:ribosome biogenesis regulatory protein homolog [Streptococcaceae bacterium]